MSETLANPPLAAARPITRWTQLLRGPICMMAISSPQYVWTLFTHPLGATRGASAAAIQLQTCG